jgi:hypothetical protein
MSRGGSPEITVKPRNNAKAPITMLTGLPNLTRPTTNPIQPTYNPLEGEATLA